jgi:plasmid stabilization system protein ParE
MAYKIVWTAEAKLTYLQIIDYLEKEWTDKEVSKFAKRVHDKLSILIEHPAIGRLHNKNRYKIYITMVTQQTSLVYHVKPLKREIVLLTFWDTRKNPKHLKY